jgi:glyoxylase-like metal-dependent hydrolase (beta-lactamase superfamily II)
MTDHRGAITREGELYPSPRRALDYLDIDPPEPGRAVQIGERLWWARIPLPMELAHINVWLMDDGDGWTLVDTGMAEEVCREAWGTLDGYLLGRPLRRIFITHDHPDHMGLSPWLAAKYGADLWMSPFAHDAVKTYLATPAAALHERTSRHLTSHGMEMPAAPRPATRNAREETWYNGLPPLAHGCADGDELSGAGRTWRLIETDGHCRGHLCLHDATNAVLISGDQVLPTISPNVSVIAGRPEGNPLRDFLTSLARLEQNCTEDTLVLPSHGKPFRGLHRRIEVVRSHHLQQLDALRVACVQPRAAYELLPVMFGRVLRGFHRLLAMGETLAHLHYLWHDGELQRELGADGIYRFAMQARGS